VITEHSLSAGVNPNLTVLTPLREAQQFAGVFLEY